jgi:hypothetical protein
MWTETDTGTEIVMTGVVEEEDQAATEDEMQWCSRISICKIPVLLHTIYMFLRRSYLDIIQGGKLGVLAGVRLESS